MCQEKLRVHVPPTLGDHHLECSILCKLTAERRYFSTAFMGLIRTKFKYTKTMFRKVD